MSRNKRSTDCLQDNPIIKWSYNHYRIVFGVLIFALAVWFLLSWLQHTVWLEEAAVPLVFIPMLTDTLGLIQFQYTFLAALLLYGLLQLLGVVGEYRRVRSADDRFTRALLIIGGLPEQWSTFLNDINCQSRSLNDGVWLELLFIQHKQARLALLKYGAWLLPISGFIGTVIGIRQAIAPLDEISAVGAQSDSIASALGEVVNGLELAFDTTLVGLLASVPVVLLIWLLGLSLERLHAVLYAQFESSIRQSGIRSDE